MNEKPTVRQTVWEYFILTLSAAIMSVEMYFFRFPNNFSFGGISGLAVELYHYFPQISKPLFMTIMDVALLILGFAVLGKSFGIRTTYIVVVSDVLMNLAQTFIPLEKPLTDEPVLELIITVGLHALAAALFFNLGASSGGSDIIAMIIKKYTNMDIGAALLVADGIVAAATFFVFDVKIGLFSITGLVVKSFLIDGLIANINRCKVFTIICSDPDPICSFITGKLERSATVQKATGAYTGDDKYIIISIVKQKQAGQLIDYLKANEPSSFFTLANSSEVVGKGFRHRL